MNRLAGPLAFVAAFAAEYAVAQAATRTVILLALPDADPAAAEATTRVQGELAAAGFHVVALPADRERAPREVETAGRELSPIGAFAIFAYPDGGGAVTEIWVSDRSRQKTVIERAHISATDHDRESEVLAVRAVELLRASLADGWPSPEPAATAQVASARVESVAPVAAMPRRRTALGSGVGIALGADVVDGFAGLGPAVMPAVAISYGFASGLRAGVSFRGLGPSSAVSTAAGRARVEEQFAEVEILKTWWPSWRVAPFVVASVGAERAHIRGSASPPFAGTVSDRWGWVMSAGVGAATPIGAGFSFMMDARAVVGWPSAPIRIDGSEVARLGGPSVLVRAGVLAVVP